MTGSVQEHLGKYSVVIELLCAPTGMKFRQILRNDVEEALKQQKRLLSKRVPFTHVSMGNEGKGTRRLRSVKVKLHGSFESNKHKIALEGDSCNSEHDSRR